MKKKKAERDFRKIEPLLMIDGKTHTIVSDREYQEMKDSLEKLFNVKKGDEEAFMKELAKVISLTEAKKKLDIETGIRALESDLLKQ